MWATIREWVTMFATWWLASEYGKATQRAAAANQEADFAKTVAADEARLDGALAAGGPDADRLRQRSRLKP